MTEEQLQNARKKLFEDLNRELERRLARSVGTIRPTARIMSRSVDQLAFAAEIAPIISDWVRSEGRRVQEHLGLVIPTPGEGDEYRRNAVYKAVDSYIGMFAHVWRPGGETPIHQHEGFLALACPIGVGAHETKYSLIYDDDHPYERIDRSCRRLSVKSDDPLPTGKVSIIPKGPGSIHVVRNNGSEHCIILEVYVHQRSPEAYKAEPTRKQPLYEINTFEHVVGHDDLYFVKRQRPDKLARPIYKRPAEGAVALSGAELLDVFRTTRKVTGAVLTARGETFGTFEELESFVSANSSRAVRIDEATDEGLEQTFVVH